MLERVIAVVWWLVLPQVVGLLASRVGRRFRAGVWPLAAAGTIAAFWAVAAFSHHRPPYGRGAVAFDFMVVFLSVANFVVGSILGTLDRRAQRS